VQKIFEDGLLKLLDIRGRVLANENKEIENKFREKRYTNMDESWAYTQQKEFFNKERKVFETFTFLVNKTFHNNEHNQQVWHYRKLEKIFFCITCSSEGASL